MPTKASTSGLGCGIRGFPARLAIAAPARSAFALRRLVGLEHRRPVGFSCIGETIPPLRQIREGTLELAAPAAQIEEVPRRAVTRMLEQPERTLSGALLETRLQRPDLLDGGFEAARD